MKARLSTTLLATLAATAALSILVAELSLALAAAVLLWEVVSRRKPWPRSPIDGPLLAYATWTLLSASFAADPVAAHENAKKLVLLLVVYVGLSGLESPDERERVLGGLLFGTLALSLLVFCQYRWLGFDTLNARPSGFLGHYMSASGVVMIGVVLAAGRLTAGTPLGRPRRREGILLGIVTLVIAVVTIGWSAGLPARLLLIGAVAVLTATVLVASRRGGEPARTAAWMAAALLVVGPVALAVSQTRNSWVGALAGLAVVATLRAPRLLWVLAAGIVAVAVAHPKAITERLTLDASTRDRYYMWQAGIDMILERPVFGQGPKMVERNYGRYRWPDAPTPATSHLHNNLVQIAAERGLPALAFWLWAIVVVLRRSWRESRLAALEDRSDHWAAAGSLAALVSILAAGMFEYNFGDSEVLILILLTYALPLSLACERELVHPA